MDRGLLRTLLWAGVVLFGLFLLWEFLAGIASAVLLMLLGVLLAVLLSAPVEALHRRKVPRGVSSPLIVVGTLAILILTVYLFFPEFQRQGTELTSQLPMAIADLMGRVSNLASAFGLNLGGSGPTSDSLGALVRQALGGVLGLFRNLIFLVVGLIAAIFLGMYLAAKPGPVVEWTVRLFPPDRRPRTREILSRSRCRLLEWFKGQLISMVIVGTLATVALYLIGVPGALLLGVLSGLLEFIPYVGPVVSAILPTLLAFALGKPTDALLVLGAYIVIQQAESNLITPLVMRHAASVHPAAVIVAVTLMGAVFGILGALLAVPTALVVGVLVKELWFEHLERG
jgi:predicted PurR-regulated permease PerM